MVGGGSFQKPVATRGNMGGMARSMDAGLRGMWSRGIGLGVKWAGLSGGR